MQTCTATPAAIAKIKDLRRQHHLAFLAANPQGMLAQYQPDRWTTCIVFANGEIETEVYGFEDACVERAIEARNHARSIAGEEADRQGYGF
jgi:hypothetical protein